MQYFFRSANWLCDNKSIYIYIFIFIYLFYTQKYSTIVSNQSAINVMEVIPLCDKIEVYIYIYIFIFIFIFIYVYTQQYSTIVSNQSLLFSGYSLSWNIVVYRRK